MSKEQIIAEIGKRIKSEYKKHSKSIPDWELIAAAKIWSMLSGEVTWRDEMIKITEQQIEQMNKSTWWDGYVNNELTLDERRAMVSQELFDKIYNAGDPSTLSHSELDVIGIPRTKTTNQTTWWGGKMNNDDNPDVIVTMSPTDVENERFKHNASGYNPSVREKNNTTGETTIEFPKQHQPEQYNPNRASLDTMVFRFEQEGNCVDGGDGETLIVEAKSSLGIDGDGGAFYVLRTEQWAINDIDDMIETLKRVKQAVEATKPTTIH